MQMAKPSYNVDLRAKDLRNVGSGLFLVQCMKKAHSWHNKLLQNEISFHKNICFLKPQYCSQKRYKCYMY